MRIFTATVDVDIDDYIDEIIEEAESDDLKKELESRGFIIAKNNSPTKPIGERIEFENSIDFKRHLCDMVDAGYYVSNEELVDLIKTKLP